MLDTRTTELLKILDGECKGGSYKVLSFSELSFTMPKKYKLDAETIRESLRDLSEKQYINIKYQDEEEICLCPLPKGRLLFENKIDETIETSRQKRAYFLYSFLGGLLGSSIAIFVAFMIYIFLLR